MIRDEHIYEIKKNPINKKILEDLFTADGSLLVLARYLIGKCKTEDKWIILFLNIYIYF